MTGNRQGAIDRVAVFGSGVVALCAAVAIARTAPGTQVTLVRTPADPAALADRLAATVPASGAMLHRLGLAEDGLIAGGVAVHRLGERFARWGRDKRDWAQGFGKPAPIGVPGAPHQLWLALPPRDRGQGLAGLFPASVLAAGDRFAEPADERSLLARVDPALRLDPARLQPLLSELARRAGVARRNGAVRAVERGADGCAAIVLDTGDRVLADLYVDASGGAATIAAGIDASRIDWSEWLPVDRLLLAEQPSPPGLADCYAANDLGWRADWPLRDRTLTGIGYRDGLDDEARALVLGDEEGGVELVALRPGRLATPWAGNVVALGDAACATGPLGSAGLALAHLHLALLLELWPAARPDPLLVREYNRRANLAADRLLDWQAAAYLLHPRRKGAFWRALQDGALPNGLAHTVAQFARRGLVPHHEEDPFSRDDWAQRLVGLGIRPRRGDPVALSVDPAVLRAALARATATTSELAGALPPYPAYLASLAARRRA